MATTLVTGGNGLSATEQIDEALQSESKFDWQRIYYFQRARFTRTVQPETKKLIESVVVPALNQFAFEFKYVISRGNRADFIKLLTTELIAYHMDNR